MVSTSAAKTTVEFLEQYGGWGLSVILMFVILYLFRFYNRKMDEISELYRNEIREKENMYSDKLDANHIAYADSLKTTCELLGSVRDGIRYCQEKNR